MKLWLLRPIEDLRDDPWDPPYDKTFGFVVRAETEDEARRLAMEDAGDEVRRWDWMADPPKLTDCPAWTSNKYSTCVELSAKGEKGVVIEDHHAG